MQRDYTRNAPTPQSVDTSSLHTLVTEGINPRTRDLDAVDLESALGLMNDEDALVAAAVRVEIPAIARAVLLAEASLRGHWQQRTAAERAEFTGLFADLFRRVYVSRIHVVDASKFQYLGDVIDRERATVKTKILTKQGSTIDVDYTVRLGDGQRWRVQDVRVEQVSLIDNYRTQFNTFIARTSYEALVQKLRGMAK